MPNERAATDIDPCAAMASSNAILPGPNLRPFAKTIRMERRELVIATMPDSNGTHPRPLCLSIWYGLKRQLSFLSGALIIQLKLSVRGEWSAAPLRLGLSLMPVIVKEKSLKQRRRRIRGVPRYFFSWLRWRRRDLPPMLRSQERTWR